jgi:UDP-N-acetylmuramoyl-L-alanyl-D-glutamate--2,6-diaminopimelate ligase
MKQIIELPLIWPVTCHTDHVGVGSTFVAIVGDKQNGCQYIPQALQKGATKIVVGQDQVKLELQQLCASYGAELISVANPRAALSELSAQAWGLPVTKLKILAVTGTKGKTTSVYALRHVLAQAGYQVAMLTGVENMIGEQKFAADLTTPQPDYLQMFLAQAVQAKCEYLIMEASAQAFSLHRLDGVKFAGAIFTNFELEHSEFYPTLEQYFAAKCELFKHLNSKAELVLNLDDQWIQKVPGLNLIPTNVSCITFAENRESDYWLRINNQGLASLQFSLVSGDACSSSFNSNQVFGDYNAYNLAGVALLCLRLGLNLEQVQAGISSFKPAPGRLEMYDLPNGAKGVVDYAHTPASFRNVLSLLRKQTDNLVVVFGAGGGKDPHKRPLMGQVATELCDTVVLTSDNPRFDDLQQIINDIVGSQPRARFLIEPDRALAIQLAYQKSSPGAIIVLLGKGPDEYQLVQGQKSFFSDRQQLLNLSFL